MNEERGKLNGLEAFLANCDEESQADDLADLRKMGVNVDAFMKRVDATVQAGYAEQLRQLAASQREQSSSAPGFLANLKTMTRAAMLDAFEGLRRGDLGERYRGLALARCRNKDVSELSDDELRSWLEDVGQVLGEPEP
jgi:hypothetical protein